MPKFLTQDEVYKILQRELPEDVYADGAPTAFFTTAENDSVAKVLSTAYITLEKIYKNYFPQEALELLSDWEIKVFGELLDGSLSVMERRDRVLAKIRSKKGITVQDMIEIVYSVIGSDKDVQLYEWGCKEINPSGGVWVLDESELDFNTYLAAQSGFEVAFRDPGLCDKTAEQLGLTEQELLDYRRQAYTFEIRIYGYTMNDFEREKLEALLTKYELVRSGHVVRDGL